MTISVDDKGLPAQLARAKAAATATVDKIKSAFSSMAESFKAAFEKMVHYAKWGAVAIAGALTLAAKAAMTQEDALFGLIAALKVSGEHSQRTVKNLRQFASEMQRLTIYGDEAILTQMAYASAMGISADKLKDSTIAAMGLSVITKNLESAMMLVAKAAAGETGSLSRYGIILDETLTKEEKFQALLKKGAELFDLAKARAETTSGALRQMKNAVGDVAEVIGFPLLSSIKDSAKAIKKWAEDNQERIGYWAKVVTAYISYGKDVFIDWIKFLRQDWVAGSKVAIDTIIELFKGFGDVLSIIMANAATRAYNMFVENLFAPIKSALLDLTTFRVYIGKKLIWEPTKGLQEEIQAWAPGVVEVPPLGPQLEASFKRTSENIKKIAEESAIDVTASHQKFVDNLAAIEAEYHPTLWQRMKSAAMDYYESAKEWFKDLTRPEPVSMKIEEPQAWWQAYETQLGFLEDLEKGERERAEKAKVLTEGAADAYRHIYGEMGRMTEESYNAQMKALTDLKTLYESYGVDVQALSGWYEEQAEILEIDYLKAAGGIAGGFQAAGMQIRREMTKWGDRAYEFSMTLEGSIARGLENTLRNFKSWKEQLLSIFEEIYWSAIRIAFIQPAAAEMAGVFSGIAGGVIGGLFGGGKTATPGTTGYGGMPDYGGPSAQHGGEVMKTGWAVIHKGETYSGEQGGRGGNVEVRIHNEYSEEVERREVSRAEEYFISDQRIIDVTMQRMQTDIKYRRSVSQASKG